MIAAARVCFVCVCLLLNALLLTLLARFNLCLKRCFEHIGGHPALLIVLVCQRDISFAQHRLHIAVIIKIINMRRLFLYGLNQVKQLAVIAVVFADKRNHGLVFGFGVQIADVQLTDTCIGQCAVAVAQ